MPPPARPAELMYEELGLDEDEGERYICSLEGSRTSLNQCAVAVGQGRRHATRPTNGGQQWEEGREKQVDVGEGGGAQ